MTTIAAAALCTATAASAVLQISALYGSAECCCSYFMLHLHAHTNIYITCSNVKGNSQSTALCDAYAAFTKRYFDVKIGTKSVLSTSSNSTETSSDSSSETIAAAAVIMCCGAVAQTLLAVVHVVMMIVAYLQYEVHVFVHI
jgi:hypothetical protein